ncbi:WD repeat-containing protein 87-like [Montipora capricornis]|uniref:WD repeat-containing protein 87-like n=1 Tax=Montipora capricornis TaxID=246305 RepID=UPI0035F213ED
MSLVSKIPLWADVYPQIKQIIENSKDTPLCVSIPYGFQMQKEIWNPEQLRVVLHVSTGSGFNFISHHGVGKKNEINIWNFSKDKKPGKLANSLQTITTDLKLLHILFLRRRWVYVTYCSDLSMRIFSAKFHSMSITALTRTVLSLAYNEARDEIITGIAGGIMTWRFPIGQKDPLIPGHFISCSFTPLDWVMSITIDDASKQILAISDVRIAMIDVESYKEKRFFQKKCDFSFTTCVFFTPASYFVTGDKNGSIRAWSTSLHSFPMVTQFLGHTAAITKLLVHPKEPLLISSSLDKTIRVWNFETGTQTFRLETGEEIVEMELLSCDLLYYHSHHHLKIWSLNLFHSLFANLSSRIKRWARVKSPEYPARVLLHSEDGGVRLLSPVHGSELTTVLPITTMSADIVDVAHDPRQEKIYLVLSTREVLVFESDTNPCCAHQLWVAESPDEGVCSLVMMNAEFALDEGEIPLRSGLLFAGHFNGQISLVSGKDVFMKESIQAHQGQVTCLRVSASLNIESVGSVGSADRLVSYGTDCAVRIWKLMHQETGYISIQQLARVKLLQQPRDLAMAGNTLCMAMADNNVIMCRVQAEKKKCGADIFNAPKKTYEFMMHSKDEGHTALINGLSSCPALGLFATSSEDHCVKIWNSNNQLVREMCFDDSLCGVCFANSRGDILVGFQSHVSLVTILNYLPLSYLEILSKMHFDNDPFEDHVQFDDLLKFWYDPDRVPRMPLKASKRRLLEPPEVKRITKRKKVHVMMALSRISKKVHFPVDDKLTDNIEEIKKPTDAQSPQELAPYDKGASLPTIDTEQSPQVFWPCAPDGFIPNSVIRQRVKPRKPPSRLIPRLTRAAQKRGRAFVEDEKEVEENRDRIRGRETTDETEEESEEENSFDEVFDESHSSPSVKGSSSSVMRLALTPVQPLLTRIVRKKWYPKLAQRRLLVPKYEEAVDNILLALSETANANVIQDILQEFHNIDREFEIPEDKKIELQDLLLKMSSNDDAVVRRSAVRALGDMGVHRRDAYLTVVRRLVDDDKKTREEAKKALKTLTGVDTMEGLSDLMSGIGVVHLNLRCNDNAVLMELADRLKKTRREKRANITEETIQEEDEQKSSLENLRKTLRRKQFKAKFRRPKVMSRKIRDTSKPRRRNSLLDEPASLTRTKAFQTMLKESQLGCKLLQKMQPFRQDIIPGYISPSRKDEDQRTESAEIRGLGLTPTPQAEHEEWLRGQGQLTVSSEIKTVRESSAVRRGDSTGHGDVRPRTSLLSPYDVLEQELWEKSLERDSLPVVSLSKIFKVVTFVTGVDKQKAKLLLLKLKRTKRIAPQEITRNDSITQEAYSFGDIMEIIFLTSPFKEVLSDLAWKARKTREEILRPVRGLFSSRSLDIIEWQNFAVIRGVGKIPLKYHEALVGLRNEVFQTIDKCSSDGVPLMRSKTKEARRFSDVLKGILGLCSLMEPELAAENQFMSEVPQATLGQCMVSLTTPEIDVGRKKKDNELPPIFEQPSLHHALGPGTLGQRLLNSTIIRAKALSDCRLHSSQQTQDFIVSTLPHRLSFHTGNKIEGESRYGIMELTWRAGTPIQPLNEANLCAHNLPGKQTALKEPFMLHSSGQGDHGRGAQIPKSRSLPPLSYGNVKPVPELNRLNLFRAVNSLHKRGSLAALAEYTKNQNVIKKKIFNNKGTSSSTTSTKTSPLLDLPIPTKALKPLGRPIIDLVTPKSSSESFERCLQFMDQTRDMTCDAILREVSKCYPFSSSRFGGSP